MLSDRCLSCLSETLVYCGQTVGWFTMPLAMEVGLGPGHILLDGDLAREKRGGTAPNFRLMSGGQTAGWIKMPLGTDVDLSPGDSVRWGPNFLTERGTAAPPTSRPTSITAKRCPSQQLLSS